MQDYYLFVIWNGSKKAKGLKGRKGRKGKKGVLEGAPFFLLQITSKLRANYEQMFVDV